MGEIAVLLTCGPLLTGGSYFVATGQWSSTVALIHTVYALGPTAVIFGKHIDKITFDRTKGIDTLPVRIGSQASRQAVVVMIVVQYLILYSLIGTRSLPWPVLLTILAAPQAIRLIKACRTDPPRSKPVDFPPSVWPLWYASFTFAYTRKFSLLLFSGLVLGWVIS